MILFVKSWTLNDDFVCEVLNFEWWFCWWSPELWMMILLVKSWCRMEACSWSQDRYIEKDLWSKVLVFACSWSQDRYIEKDLWPKVFAFTEAQQMQRMRLSLDEELSRCLQYTVCNNCASCRRGRVVLTSRVGQIPSTGLRHPSSNHCRNWVRHRSATTVS